MASKKPLPVKITDSVLKDCYQVLKGDLNEEVIDHLWSKNCITQSERTDIKSIPSPVKRNEKLLDILSTK